MYVLLSIPFWVFLFVVVVYLFLVFFIFVFVFEHSFLWRTLLSLCVSGEVPILVSHHPQPSVGVWPKLAN